MDLVPGKSYTFVYGDGSESDYVVEYVKTVLRNGAIVVYFKPVDDYDNLEVMALFPSHFGNESGQIKSVRSALVLRLGQD